MALGAFDCEPKKWGRRPEQRVPRGDLGRPNRAPWAQAAPRAHDYGACPSLWRKKRSTRCMGTLLCASWSIEDREYNVYTSAPPLNMDLPMHGGGPHRSSCRGVQNTTRPCRRGRLNMRYQPMNLLASNVTFRAHPDTITTGY